MDVTKFRVPCAIEEVFYIPEFVSMEEEEYLQRKVADSSSVKWKTLPNRRLQVWGESLEYLVYPSLQAGRLPSYIWTTTGGELTTANTLIPQNLPEFITNYPNIITRLRDTGVFSSSKHGQPNHVIVNEYQPGQGIMPHEDGPSYHPVVATLSLGSHAVFNYHRYLEEYDLLESSSTASSPSATKSASAGRAIDPTPVLSLLLEPRSVVITAKLLYSHHLHAIEPLERDLFTPADPDSMAGLGSGNGVKVANWRMLRGERESHVARDGGVLERGTRLSLTCRDIERVVGGKALGKVFTRQP